MKRLLPFALMTLASSAALSAPPAPLPGAYVAESVITGAEGQCGSDFLDEVFSGVVDYQGPGGATVVYHTIGAGGLLRTVYTITGGLGTRRQSGTFVGTRPGSPPVSGQFTAQFAYFDQHSFSISLTGTNGFCTETIAVYLIHI